MYVNSLLIRLSAYLYEETHEPIYAQAAQLSLDFIIHQMWNGTIVYDTFDPAACTWDDTEYATYNQAWFVEGIKSRRASLSGLSLN